MQPTQKKKLKKIKLVIPDVDGVLTDGGMYYSKDGEYLKKFNTRDAMGMELLLKKGIKPVMLTRENSSIVKTRAKKIKVSKLYSGILDKNKQLKKILKEYGLSPEQIAYIGDDVNDFEIMKSVGFACSPNDGIKQIQKISDYVCKLNGGNGVFREFADIIISCQTN